MKTMEGIRCDGQGQQNVAFMVKLAYLGVIRHSINQVQSTTVINIVTY